MEDRQTKRISSRMLRLWTIIAILLMAGGTYAWFQFNTVTNVEPDTAGAVTDGEATLLISNTRDGEYAARCKLLFDSNGGNLEPISTSGLDSFYRAGGQNSKGISVLYSDATADINNCTMHGSIYLKAEGGALDVYLYQPQMTFGSDVQAVASMRLGLKVNDKSGTSRYIFRLDDMMDVSYAESQQTTTMENCVVNSVSSGSANYVRDVALNISDYTAGGSSSNITAGKNKIATVSNGDIVSVEYWLYLEGCDENCINSVQNKDVKFAMSFAGTASK